MSMGVSPWKAGSLYFGISRWQSSRLQKLSSAEPGGFVRTLLWMCVGDEEETAVGSARALLTSGIRQVEVVSQLKRLDQNGHK